MQRYEEYNRQTNYFVYLCIDLPFLSDRQRENVRRIEGDYLSQRRVSLYIREDYIRQRMLNTITETLLRFMPDGKMEEQIVKYGIKL